jgi:1,4-alpha-glucan branching enzyme
MPGYLSMVLHAHLPFVRHPEHARFLEENWLFEAITETYIPLLGVLEAWEAEGLHTPLTLTLTPTLCAMLRDPLLRSRYEAHLENLIELVEKETRRTLWEKPFHKLALFYRSRLLETRAYWQSCQGDLVGRFRRLQDAGRLEIITCAATHALLPLLDHPPSVRAQVLVARDEYRACFGCEPRGIWLPECAYVEGLESVLQEAGLRWFIVDSHGLLRAEPRPRYGLFAPVALPNGVAAFGRDLDSAKQVWSREGGYPGDPRYREFYRDIGFDLDVDYLRPHLAGNGERGFTGIKYHRVTGPTDKKAPYDREAALEAASEHARHFCQARLNQVERLQDVLERPPLVVTPYDAELFGHWWYEGPDFLDRLVREIAAANLSDFRLEMITPTQFLERHPQCQVAMPAASSWGDGGHLAVWLNEQTAWIYPHLRTAQERMSELVRIRTQSSPFEARALRQAGRELLLAQASDWPFILRHATSPDYARGRLTAHLQRFTALYEQLATGQVDEPALTAMEAQDNLFPDLEIAYWK